MADGLPQAQVAHRIPHRLRVHIPSRKGDQAYFHRVSERLGGQPFVRFVRVSPRTGSITIEHDAHAQEVARLARELEVFDLPEAAVAHVLAERLAGRVVGIEPTSAVSAGLAGMGVYQALRGNLLGSGVEHLWHAYGAVRMLGSFKIAAVMALLGAYQMVRGRVLNPAASLFFYALMVRAINGHMEGKGRPDRLPRPGGEDARERCNVGE